MKRKIVKLMAINKKEETIIEEKLKRPIHGFKDNEKVGRIPNEIFPLFITAVMENFDIS